MIVAFAFAILAAQWRRADTFGANEASQLLEGATDAANAAADARPVYPYSIILGGAHLVAELKAAIDADPVVRTHFASFDLSRTRVETLDTPRVAHVSYRVGNNVYWTRKTVILSTGEKVLTDGQHVARTRCGNQVAEVPGIVGPDEPAPDLLDTALGRGPLTGLSTPIAAPWATSGVGPLSSVGSGGSGPAPGPSGSFPGGGVSDRAMGPRAARGLRDSNDKSYCSRARATIRQRADTRTRHRRPPVARVERTEAVLVGRVVQVAIEPSGGP